MAWLTCVLTVSGLTNSRSAISSLLSPSATSAMTSRSRSVRLSMAGERGAFRVRAANS
jgi:hypothetical protein